MQKICGEQNINIFNKDRIRPCTCITLPHSSHCNPGPGSNKTLFIKTSPPLTGQSLPFNFLKFCLQILFIFLAPLKFCAGVNFLSLLNPVPSLWGMWLWAKFHLYKIPYLTPLYVLLEPGKRISQVLSPEGSIECPVVDYQKLTLKPHWTLGWNSLPILFLKLLSAPLCTMAH